MSGILKGTNLQQVFVGGKSMGTLGSIVKSFEFDNEFEQYMHVWRCSCPAKATLIEKQDFGVFAEIKQSPEGNTNNAQLRVRQIPGTVFDIRASKEFQFKGFCAVDITKQIVDISVDHSALQAVKYVDQRHKEVWTMNEAFGISTDVTSNLRNLHPMVCQATKTVTYSFAELSPITSVAPDPIADLWSSEVTSTVRNCVEVWRRVTIVVDEWVTNRQYTKTDLETGRTVTVTENVLDAATGTPSPGTIIENIPFRCGKFLNRSSTIDSSGSWTTTESMGFTFPAVLENSNSSIVFLQRQRTHRGYYNTSIRASFSQQVEAQVTNTLSTSPTAPTDVIFSIQATGMSYQGVIGNAHMSPCIHNLSGNVAIWTISGSAGDINFPGGLTETAVFAASTPTSWPPVGLKTVRVSKTLWKYGLYLEKIHKITMI